MKQKIELTLYCKNSSTGEYVKMLLQEQSEKFNYELTVIQVEDTDTYIKESIESIPAVKIGSEIRCKGSLDAETFASQINQWIMDKLNTTPIRRLIVPIDYSDQSEKALEYAIALSQKVDGYIELTHIYHPNYIEAENMPMVNTVIEKQEQDRLIEYKENIQRKWTKNNPTLTTRMNSLFLMGFPSDTLIELSYDGTPSIIIMGTTGQTGLFKNVFGSVSTKVARQAKCPVIVVPPDTNVGPIKRMVYCSENVDLDAEVLDQLLDIVRPFDADIHILHYIDGGDDDYSEIDFIKLISGKYPKERIQFELIEGSPSATKINEYAIKNEMDIIAMSRKDRGILGNIFHKSLTSRLAVDVQLPLLFLHKNN